MKTSALLFCLGLLCLAFGLKAQTKTFPGGEAHVLAIDGIPLRDKPDVSGKKLATIPSGTKLKLLGQALASFTSDGVAGNWRKVKYNNQEGFVFDGFLTDLPPVSAMREDWSNYGISNTSEIESRSVSGPEEFTWDFSLSTHYDNGLVHFHFAHDCLEVEQWELKGRGIEEAFIWLRGCYPDIKELRTAKLSDPKITQRDAKGRVKQVLIQQEGFYVKIYQEGDKAITYLHTWCP